MLKFLGNGGVASVGNTSWMLCLIARDELRKKATQYLINNNSWKLGFWFYSVQGYYGRPFGSDGDDNELGG